MRRMNLGLRCLRCERGSTRLVAGLCISCCNREHEIRRGSNARGYAPAIAGMGLYLFTALLTGAACVPRCWSSSIAPKMIRCAAGMLVEMLAASEAEVQRYAARECPGASVTVIHQSRCLSEIFHWQARDGRGFAPPATQAASA
jgi:hypothetical protein